MTCPKTQNFSAWINVMPGSEHKLIVVGEVETTAGNLQPKLAMAVPQGINPSILLLNLTIEETGDVGTKDIAFRDVRFEMPASEGQYTSVSILHEGTVCLGFDVSTAS